jgi:hypothetical protein
MCNKLCFDVSTNLLESLEDALSPRVGRHTLSDACVNTDMLQFRGWFFVSTRPRSQGYPDGVAERKSVETKTPNSAVPANSIPRKCVLCI